MYISFRFAPPPPPPPAFTIDPELPVEGRVELPELGILDPPVNALVVPTGPDGGPGARDPGPPGCPKEGFWLLAACKLPGWPAGGNPVDTGTFPAVPVGPPTEAMAGLNLITLFQTKITICVIDCTF